MCFDRGPLTRFAVTRNPLSNDGERKTNNRQRKTGFRKPPWFYGNWKVFDKLALGIVQLAWFIATFVSG